MKVVAFKATPDRLTQEKQEATLHWETQGASSVRIEPGDEIKDPKASGAATVHPSAETTYKLIATWPAGLTLESLVSIGIGLPSIKQFEVTHPPPGARIFPGDPVQFNWIAEGSSRATISASTGDVLPGKLQLDVSAGPPAVARPATVGTETREAMMDRAFLIGIGRYSERNQPVENDLEVLVRALEYRGYQPSEIRVFENSHTTRSEVLELFDSIRAAYTNVDQGSCYLHIGASGALSPSPLQGGILPTDGVEDDFRTVVPFSLLNNCLPNKEDIDVVVTIDA